MVAPVITVTGDTLLDAIIVVAMLVVEVFLLTQIVPRRGPPPPIARMVVGSSALLGSAGVLMSVIQAFLNANLDSYTVVLFTFNFMMLAPPGLWIIAVIVYHDRAIDAKSWSWPVAIVAMATLAEVLMGLLFTVADGSSLALANVLAGTLTSAWYLWSMVGAMVALILWIPLPRLVAGPLLGLAAAGFVAPWVVADPVVGAVLEAVAMGATVGVFYGTARRAAATDPSGYRLLLAIFGAFVVMTLSGFVVALANDALVAELAFGGVMSVVMVGEFLYLVREGLWPSWPRPSVGGAATPTAPVATLPEPPHELGPSRGPL